MRRIRSRTARRPTTRASSTTSAAATSSRARRRRTSTDHGDHTPHESPLTMLIPLAVLALGALVAGFAAKECVHRPRLRRISGSGSLFTAPDNKILEEMHHVPVVGGAVAERHDGRSASSSPGGCTSATRRVPARLAADHPLLYRFLLNKWYFDELYDLIFVRPAMWLGRFLWTTGDGRIIDGLGPGRRRGARHRRDPRRRAAADRLRLPLRLRDADRRRGADHLVPDVGGPGERTDARPRHPLRPSRSCRWSARPSS